jgi:predicted RNase H-like nuclease
MGMVVVHLHRAKAESLMLVDIPIRLKRRGSQTPKGLGLV